MIKSAAFGPTSYAPVRARRKWIRDPAVRGGGFRSGLELDEPDVGLIPSR